jgi:hypothetical protein
MPRKKTLPQLVEVALDNYRGRLVTIRYDVVVKIKEGHMETATAPYTAPEYVLWKKATPAVFVGIHRGKKTPAGKTTGWAAVMVNGILGYVQPGKIRHILLMDEDD